MTEGLTKKNDKTNVEYEARVKVLIGNADPIKYDILDILFRGIPDIGLICIFLITFFIIQTIDITVDYKLYIQFLISSGALLISAVAFYTVLFRKWDNAFSEYKAGKICKSLKYDEETKVLLASLIFMKLKQPKIKLMTIYNLEPEIFEKKNLIQSLYE
jgi:hypothetical protein